MPPALCGQPFLRGKDNHRPNSAAWVVSAVFALLLLLALTVASCTRGPFVRPQVSWDAYTGVVVPNAVLPFEASGSAMLHYRGERESGSIHLEGMTGPAYALRLSARIIGTTALEVRFTADNLLLLDYSEEAYYLGPNTPANRMRVFSLDLNPTDFQMALTGRITKRNFQQGGGILEAELARFTQNGSEYQFQLGEDGLPVEWTKTVAGVIQYRVVYPEYMDVETGGATFRTPRKIRIYQGSDVPLAVLGLGTFRPWRENPGDIELSVAPDVGLRYLPLDGAPPR